MRDSPHYEAHSCARTHKEGGWVRGMCRDSGSRECQMAARKHPGAHRAASRTCWLLAPTLVVCSSPTVRSQSRAWRRLCSSFWWREPMGKPRKGKGERKRACRSPLESGACRRSPCRRRPNATGSGRCLYAGSIHRSVFRARVLAGLPAPHAGTGSRQTRTGCDSDPTTDTNNGLCRAFRQRW